MDHCLPDDRLLDHSEGRLVGTETDAASAHLATCADCRSTLAKLVILRQMAGGDRAQPGARAEARVFEAIRRASGAVPPRRWSVIPMRWAVAAGLLLALLGGLIGVGTRPVKAEAVVATVASTDARVVVRRRGVERSAAVGMDLHAGDEVAVPVDATAVLTLSDHSRAELGPESTFAFHDPKGHSPLELRGGFLAVDAVDHPANHPLTICTPDARAEVVGTRFTMGTARAETHLRVAEGLVHLVRLDDGASVDVAAGNRAAVNDGDRGDLQARPSLSGTVLLIVSYDNATGDFSRFNALIGDRLLGRRLRHLGFRVETKSHADVTAADLVGRPLVIVSYSAENVGFEESLTRIGLKTAAVPVLCFEPVVFPTLGLTGALRGRDFEWEGESIGVEFPNPEHPLSAGLSGTRRDLFDKLGCFGWAHPAASSQLIATVKGDRSRAIVFAYEAGTAMVDGTAPRRRVGLLVNPSRIGPETIPAWSFVEAAVEWCVEPPRSSQAGGVK